MLATALVPVLESNENEKIPHMSNRKQKFPSNDLLDPCHSVHNFWKWEENVGKPKSAVTF